ncbi:hypothetical protein [Ornithinimicrobium kibberense]|uniref:hypothetical protein n=1 Tax=Ornithinimicrobium kibberense TaxID=282060 RepID=UPI00360AD2B5
MGRDHMLRRGHARADRVGEHGRSSRSWTIPRRHPPQRRRDGGRHPRLDPGVAGRTGCRTFTGSCGHRSRVGGRSGAPSCGAVRARRDVT